MTRLIRGIPVAAALLAGASVLGYLLAALPSGEALNEVSGVWLALARDTRDGVFYRAVAEAGLYGGTRYFPLLFLAIAAFMRLGLSAMRAGQLASGLGAAALAAGVFAFLRADGHSRTRASVGAILALAPYFVLQTIVEVRAEPLAAGLAWLGAACVRRHLNPPAAPTWLRWAAVCFTLAFAAKPTAGYAAIAAALALCASHRFADGWRILRLSLTGWTLVLLAIALVSQGRALENFRACALAGGTVTALLAPASLIANVVLLAKYHYLTGGLLCAALLGALEPARWRSLPVLMALGALLSSLVVLGSPGTILSNQTVEPYAAAAVVVVAGSAARWAPLQALLLSALLCWAGAQDVREIGRIRRVAAPAAPEAARTAVAGCAGPLLSESPLVPVLIGQRPLLLDPFAFRVMSLSNPGIALDLVRRLERREFGCVILGKDPETARGLGWYRNVDLGERVLAAIQHAYRIRTVGATHRTYAPSGDASLPKTPASR